MKSIQYLPICALLISLFSTGLNAQTEEASTSISKSLGLYVFPNNDQNSETQSQDETTCYQWAVNESGVDPMNPPEVAPEQVDTGPDGAAVGGAAKGAAAGAAIGAIAGDAGMGAAIGASAGALRGRRQSKAGDAKQQEQNVQAANQAEEDMMNNFKKAFSVCMEAKGYTIK